MHVLFTDSRLSLPFLPSFSLGMFETLWKDYTVIRPPVCKHTAKHWTTAERILMNLMLRNFREHCRVDSIFTYVGSFESHFASKRTYVSVPVRCRTADLRMRRFYYVSDSYAI